MKDSKRRDKRGAAYKDAYVSQLFFGFLRAGVAFELIGFF